MSFTIASILGAGLTVAFINTQSLWLLALIWMGDGAIASLAILTLQNLLSRQF